MFPITARLDLNSVFFLLATLGRKAVPKILYPNVCILLRVLKIKKKKKKAIFSLKNKHSVHTGL